MRKRHFTIPVFIPMEACPFHCIYCDQVKISGHAKMPGFDEVKEIINKHLTTIPSDHSVVEVGFFGGTFTGLKKEIQENYLKVVFPFIQRGKISSVRISTRPDFIDQIVIDLLKKYSVKTIELGAQSMDDDVLQQTARGHTAEDVANAARLIKMNQLRLGLQMMIGLPGDSKEKSLLTASKFIELAADDVRIYPTLVIRGTWLEKLFQTGEYRPLSLGEAIVTTAGVIQMFEAAGTNIIRVGLHPSEGLINGESLVAGPFHNSFRELVNTRIWNNLLCPLCSSPANEITLTVAPREINFAVGFNKSNRKMLEASFQKVVFKTSDSLKNREFHVDYR